jgi:Tol biopolymer transport system component
MNASMRSEQDLARLLVQLAEGARPDYRDSLVEVVARTPQRRAWTIPGRWLPMDTSVQRLAPATTFRIPLALLLVLALVAAGLVALAVASRPHVPAPFGPAVNGAVIYGANGDLFLLDPATHASKPFLVDPVTVDVAPQFSLDGRHVAFGREIDGRHAIYVANADGTGVRALTAPLLELSSFAWSPDGRTIAAAHVEHGYPQVTLLAIDGSAPRNLDIGVPAEDPVWRPPDGHQLLVRVQLNGFRELLLVDVATGETHQLPITHLVGGGNAYDGQRATWSPDGTQLTYEQGQIETGSFGGPMIRLHIAEVTDDGRFTSDRRVVLDPKSDYEYLGRWLTTGDRFAFATQQACKWQVWIAPDADLTRAAPVGEPFEDCVNNEGIGYELSPDATRVFTVRGTLAVNDPVWVSNTDGTDRVPLSIVTSEDMSWQRNAP